MEQHFSSDFSRVRVHADARSAASAAALGARAYTLGRDIVFAAGEYRPGSPVGDELLAHELTHVLQQRAHHWSELQPASLAVSAETDPAEADARAWAADLTAGRRRSGPTVTTVGPTVQRAIPSGREPHDDPVSQEALIQIEAAKKLLERSDLTPEDREEIEEAIKEAEKERERYRWDVIGTGGHGPTGAGGLGMTTTMNPFAAVAAGIILVVGAIATAPPDVRTKTAAALSEALRDLARPLNRIARTRTAPAPEPKPTETFDPVPDPKPDPSRRRRRRKECATSWFPPAGGDPIHDEYSRIVATKYGNPTFATLNYWMQDDLLVADFDHYNPDANELFEAKTRHEILMREWARNQPAVVARLMEQATRQDELRQRCAPSARLLWFFDVKEVADVAREYLAGIVDEVVHEPWDRRLPESLPPTRGR
jgi:hypothetical protein